MRAAGALAAAAGFGLALAMVFTSESGIAGGQRSFLVMVVACVYLGWLATQLSETLTSLVAAPALILIMTLVLLAVKLVRMPTAPLIGDDFEYFVAIYAGLGVLGALIGHVPWLRASPSLAGGSAALITAVAVALSFAAYAPIGS